MRNLRNSCLLVAFTCIAAAPGRMLAADPFPLKEGDTWVMAGDSITAQHLHSNYFEAFCFARYPKLTFRFRNSGVGGDTVPKVLARFDWDVAQWQPTIVSVELGMNDQGGFSTEQYIANMGKLSDRIKALKARPVWLTASPINNGDTMANLGRNAKLNQFALALKTFAGQQESPYADQFHLVIDVWGKNKPKESLANALPGLKSAAQDDSLAGVEHLRSFLAAQAKGPGLVSMQGDPVHPGPCGQLTMAAALLKELKAQGFVSSVVVDAAGKVIEAKGCVVENAKSADGKLEFDRLDECLPFPIPDEARPVLPLFPTISEMSQYTLRVPGLKGSCTLKVNGETTANLSAADLERGVNLTAYGKGPIADQGKKILAAVSDKEKLVGDWRKIAKSASSGDAKAKEALAGLTKQVEEADVKIRDAAKPQKLHFELVPVK